MEVVLHDVARSIRNRPWLAASAATATAQSASTDSGGSRNFVGYSYGSTIAAQSALDLARSGTRVDTLVLVGTPIDPESDLYQALLQEENIGQIVRVDVQSDPFSAGIHPDRAGEHGMDPHFFFIGDGAGQHGWLADVVGSAIEWERAHPGERRELTVTADPFAADREHIEIGRAETELEGSPTVAPVQEESSGSSVSQEASSAD